MLVLLVTLIVTLPVMTQRQARHAEREQSAAAPAHAPEVIELENRLRWHGGVERKPVTACHSSRVFPRPKGTRNRSRKSTCAPPSRQYEIVARCWRRQRNHMKKIASSTWRIQD